MHATVYFLATILLFLFIFTMVIGLFPRPAAGQTVSPDVHGPDADSDVLDPDVLARFRALADLPQVKEALRYIEADHDRRVSETLELVQIPASPFNEQEKAQELARRFRELGLDDVHIDAEGNVLGYLRGETRRPKLAITAHLDTVFPLGYDPTPRIDEDGVIHGPGIGDDTAGLTALLSMIRAMNAAGIKPQSDILFVGTVGEEGSGDLRGVKYLFHSHSDIDGFLSVDDSADALSEPELWPISYNALGSKRYEFQFNGPGGHSFLAFGTPSAVHAMGRAIAHIAEMRVPDNPKTTFSASVVRGGSSVNAIAAQAVLQTDTRSASPEQLEKTVDELIARVKLGVAEENARWGRWEVTVNPVLIGDRPSGTQPVDSPLVQAAIAAATVLPHSIPAANAEPVSTDANIALYLGVPAATLARGGVNAGAHTPQESWDPRGAWKAVQNTLLTALGLVGVSGVSEPMLPIHPGYEYVFEGLSEIPAAYVQPGREYRFSWYP